MKGAWVRAHGGLDAILLEELPTPSPGPGEVLIKVKACGLNHLDVWVRKGVPGHQFPLPLILGNDIAGLVEQAGPGVGAWSAGDEVVVAPGTACGGCLACASGRDHHCRGYAIFGEHRHGGCAEYALVPAVNLLTKPKNLSYAQAASVGIAWLTAWHMLTARAGLKAGETVLVQAAGSGVGSAAIQIAKRWGARVIATASSEEKLARAKELGADHVAKSSEVKTLLTDIKRLTNGAGCDVVFEHVGAATWPTSLRALAWQGRLVTCGATTGNEVALNLNHLFFKNQSILGSTMGGRGEFFGLWPFFERGEFRPVLQQTLPLGEIRRAHELLESRAVFGKIVIEP